MQDIVDYSVAIYMDMFTMDYEASHGIIYILAWLFDTLKLMVTLPLKEHPDSTPDNADVSVADVECEFSTRDTAAWTGLSCRKHGALAAIRQANHIASQGLLTLTGLH